MKNERSRKFIIHLRLHPRFSGVASNQPSPAHESLIRSVAQVQKERLRMLRPLTQVLIVITRVVSMQSTQADRIAECGTRGRATAQASVGFPRFDRQLLLESTSETSANVSIGDLNGDGNLDIVLIKGRHWPLISRVLLGDGQGHFPNAYNLCETAY